jgi:hypothetical protein
MRTLLLATAIVASTLTGAVRAADGQSPVAPPTAQALVEGLKCTPFNWVRDAQGRRAALTLPVEIEGKAYEYQLDTGADASFVYGGEEVAQGWGKDGDGGARVQSVKLGGGVSGPAWLVSLPKMKKGGGTVGLDLLLGKVAVIDYPRQRFCLMAAPDFPYAIYKRTRWSNATLRNGKLFVPVTIGGQKQDGFFFDTGASLLSVSVDETDWRALTGKTDATQATQVVEGTAWGKPIRIVGAPGRDKLEIAGVAVDSPTVFFNTADPEHYRKYPFPARGLIGNAAVWDEVVVLYLGPQMMFGVVR